MCYNRHMKKLILIVVTLLVCVVLIVNNKTDAKMSEEEQLWNLVQNFKVETSKPYIKSQELCEIALERSKQVQISYNHDAFKINGDYYYERSGFNYFSENISSYGNPKDGFQAWLDSPSHREALEADYTHSCIKCSGTYCVQIFGKY